MPKDVCASPEKSAIYCRQPGHSASVARWTCALEDADYPVGKFLVAENSIRRIIEPHGSLHLCSGRTSFHFENVTNEN